MISPAPPDVPARRDRRRRLDPALRLGWWIARVRHERGLSETQFANAIGIPSHFVYLYEMGLKVLDSQTLRRIVRWVDCAPDISLTDLD